MNNTLGLNQTFPIYNADGTAFHGLELKKSTSDSVVMSLGDKITGDVYYKDNTLAVTMREYIEYKQNPEDENEEPIRYSLVTPPTIVREGMVTDNTQLKGMTKYSFTFYHPMYMLGNIPFTDVAVMSSQEKYLSQNKTFYWIGKIADFVAKINKNLQGTEWVVVLNSNNISAETLNTLSEVLSFDKDFVSDALKTAYDTWEIPFVIDSLHKGDYTYTDANNDVVDYYDEGKRFVVLFGLPSNEITNSAENFQVQTDDYLFGGIYMNTTAITLSTGDVITIGSDESGFIVDSYRTILANKTYKATSSQNVYVARIGQGAINYTIGRVFVFRFGQGVGLKNNSRTPKNNKIVTRIIGFGSENNIPYGYPQIEWEGDSRWEYTKYENDDAQIDADGKPHGTPTVDAYPLYNGIVGGRYVKLIKHPFTRKNLMPSVYSDTVNKKVNPYATGYNPNIEIKDYYDAVYSQDYPYENEINNSAPSAHIQGFEDIKPELGNNVAILNVVPLDKNLEPTSSWDDSIDDNGVYNQSYFRITIPRLTFDLYACAAITQQMQINMRSGACLGCTFTVSVDWDDYKANFYDSDGNFAPSGQQRDTTKYPDSRYSSIHLIVQKDLDTFGTIMPNIYQQPQNGDTFVILGISLPTSYISAAEYRLDDAMKKYMLENNTYYYEYPLKFDEHFLATHTDILKQIRNNSIVRFLFANEEKSLYVKQITVKYGDKPLPQYDIALTEDVDITLNQIGQVEKELHSLEKAVTNSAVSTSAQTDRFFNEVTLENGSKAVKLKTSYKGLFTDGFLTALGVGSEQGGGGGGGSVTSIGMSVPQGFTVSPSSISQSGTFAIGFASGYSLPSNNLQDSWTAKQDTISDLATIRQNAANGNTAYESLNGYALKSYLEGNWLVKSLGSIRQSPATVLDNGDEVVCGVSLNSGVLQVSYGNLSIPTKTSDLTNDSGFITSSALSGYLPLTGGTMTGSLTIGNVTIYSTGSNGGINSILIGDDAYIGDGNMAGGIGIKAKSSTVQAGIKFFANEKSCGELVARADKSLTYEGNLIWHAGNDGSGSGLDADTVDGYHAYQMMTKHAWENEYDNTAGLKIITVSNRTDIFDDNVPRWGSVLQWSNAYYQPSEVNSGNWYNQLFGINQDGGRLYYRNRENGGNWKTLHKIAYTTDNVASATYATSAGNADTLDGNHASWFVNEVGQNDFDVKRPGYIITADNDYDTTTAHPFDIIGGNQATILQCIPNTEGNYGSQLAIGFGHPRLAWRNRYGSTTWSVWQQIIAGSADTLTTARSLWGQSFDGSGNVDGNLTFGSGYGINNLHTIYCANADLNHTLYLGYGGKDRVTWHEYGNDWQFWYGQGTGERTGGTLSVRLGATNYFEGNVGIGNLSPTYKLDVEGTLRATGNILTNGYVQIGNARLVWDSTNNAIRVEGVSGTANLYTTGGLSALGFGTDSSVGSISTLTVTNEIRLSGYNGSHVIKNETVTTNGTRKDYLTLNSITTNGGGIKMSGNVNITGKVDITGHVGIGDILYIGDDYHYIELFDNKLQLSAYSEIQLNNETTIASSLTVNEDIWAYGKIYFGNTGYLYTSGNNLYWHNNSTNTNTKLA